jgi:hypothetical protein
MDLIEDLKDIISDNKVHISVAIIKKLHLAKDKSFLKVSCDIFPENREIVARMTWESVGPESGIFSFPQINDMVLVAIAEGDEDQAFIIKRLTSKVDKIPVTAVDGSTVIKALEGKKVWITSNNKIFISKEDSDPTENLVLGQEFKTAYSDHLDNDAKHTHIGNLGYATSPPMPTFLAKYQQLKASPVDDEKMLSDIAFTEKGD